MKKIIAILILISAVTNAQNTIKGTLQPALESDWVILYKIEGAQQVFVQNTTIKKDTVTIDGKQKVVSNFQFLLPKKTQTGTYRATYNLEGAGFVDFIYNKENVSFNFNPTNPFETLSFSESKENIQYLRYQTAIFEAQRQLDSIQVLGLKNVDLKLSDAYKEAYDKVNRIQEEFIKSSKGTYIAPFIKASSINNSSTIFSSPESYRANLTSSFFDAIDFSDKTLLNSPFLVSKISDYIFYLNTSDDKKTQQDLYKESLKNVFAKVTNVAFKKELVEFLITQFESLKNVEIVDELFNHYYSSHPISLQDAKFKSQKLALLSVEVGRIAPDFSWEENGETIKLSDLNKAKNYVLVFWSTECSHCLKAIPKLYKYLQGKPDISVIAYSLEKTDFKWKRMKQDLPNWYHVLGLNKWENKIVTTYHINSTPDFFILDADKKIIARPYELKDVKEVIEQF